MSKLLLTALGRLRVVGFLEGVSFVLLVGLAMPLKYFAGEPGAVRVVGMAHGILFLLYLLALFLASVEYGWKWRRIALLFVASLLPFGPFVVDARVLKKLQEGTQG
jgi:integral membrane protein